LTVRRCETIFPIGTIMAQTRFRRIRTAADVGAIVREVRRASELDQATAAGMTGVGPRFLGDVERGKTTVRLGLVLQVLDRLGLDVWIAPRNARPRTEP
jgi:hypothetical protein